MILEGKQFRLGKLLMCNICKYNILLVQGEQLFLDSKCQTPQENRRQWPHITPESLGRGPGMTVKVRSSMRKGILEIKINYFCPKRFVFPLFSHLLSFIKINCGQKYGYAVLNTKSKSIWFNNMELPTVKFFSCASTY